MLEFTSEGKPVLNLNSETIQRLRNNEQLSVVKEKSAKIASLVKDGLLELEEAELILMRVVEQSASITIATAGFDRDVTKVVVETNYATPEGFKKPFIEQETHKPIHYLALDSLAKAHEEGTTRISFESLFCRTYRGRKTNRQMKCYFKLNVIPKLVQRGQVIEEIHNGISFYQLNPFIKKTLTQENNEHKRLQGNNI